MNSTVTITSPAGTVIMNAANQHTDGAYQVGAQFFSDWYTLSDSKSEVRERPATDNAFGIDRDWRASLQLSMTGRFRGATWPTMLRTLRSLLAVGVPVTVTVNDDLGQSSRLVSVRRFVPVPNPGAQYVEFQVVMVATDARMYGPPQSEQTGPPTAGTGQPWPQVWPAPWGTAGNSGRATAVNGGGRATPLTLTVSAAMDGVELVEIVTGRILRLERTIPTGSVVVFDSATTRAYLDVPSNDITGFMTRREWAGFLIPAGGNATVQFNPLGTVTGSPMLTLGWADAN